MGRICVELAVKENHTENLRSTKLSELVGLLLESSIAASKIVLEQARCWSIAHFSGSVDFDAGFYKSTMSDHCRVFAFTSFVSRSKWSGFART